jgi:hypothetical protein
VVKKEFLVGGFSAIDAGFAGAYDLQFRVLLPQSSTLL